MHNVQLAKTGPETAVLKVFRPWKRYWRTLSEAREGSKPRQTPFNARSSVHTLFLSCKTRLAEVRDVSTRRNVRTR